VTLDAWLRQRTPAPPDRLLARIQERLGDRREKDAGAAPELCLDAAEQLLRELIARPSMGRDAALDLLTADALTTYAFEAAADADAASLATVASAAMTRLGAFIPV
jgi:uncharacterized membrane protein